MSSPRPAALSRRATSGRTASRFAARSPAVFDGFEPRTIDTGEATIRLRLGGEGPPVLLLHGHPQTHAMWHAVAPRLAGELTVVAADLRGYGGGSKPPPRPPPPPHPKR